MTRPTENEISEFCERFVFPNRVGWERDLQLQDLYFCYEHDQTGITALWIEYASRPFDRDYFYIKAEKGMALSEVVALLMVANYFAKGGQIV